jgi:hypothetical protein
VEDRRHLTLKASGRAPDIAEGGRAMRATEGASPRAGRRFGTAIAATMLVCVVLFVLPQPATARPKRLASGLMTVGNTGDWPAIVDVWVPAITWKQLQPAPNRFRFGVIADHVRRARASGDVLRLRIMAGRFAPDWVKRRFGTVAVTDPVDGISAKVPRWWKRGYMDAYRRFQAHLAARFDGNATIRSVTVSGAMTIYAEPFIRGVSDARTRRALLAAGYAAWKDRRAIVRSLAAQRPWQRTRQIMSFNAWQFVRSDGTFGNSPRFTNRVMNRFRGMFGRRAILQNNSIRASWVRDMPRVIAPIFRHMRELGRPLSYQTARTSRVGDLALVLEWCLQQGAHGVELHRGASDRLTTTQARSYDSGLEANA